ncbi:glycosyltransferase family 4 protein [Patescibacteria group bacterium]|nr:glycosyltransferase family 4 protein [Patescibacteria group bacterium]
MKILILAEHPNNCGSLSIQGNLLYKGLIENGVDCRICHYKYRKKEKEWYFKVFKPDVVIGIGWWVDIPTIVNNPLEFGLQPVPWILADGWVANYHGILSNLPLVFTTSSWVKETYKRDGVETKNYEVLHVGYDAKKFKPISKEDPGIKEIRKMVGIREDEKMILTAGGGDVTSKGAQEMIRALAKVDKKYSNWKYVCKAGNSKCARDHHQEELALINELKLDPNKFVYITDDFHHNFMPYLLNACDIYAAPSRLEGFGMIQVEAMACGKPVISIDAMGPKDTIIHGKTGFLAKVGSTIDLAEEWVNKEMGFKEVFRMKFDKPKTLAYRADIDDLAKFTLDLLANDDLREKMGTQAAQHALDNFQYQNLAQKCANIIKEKLNIG